MTVRIDLDINEIVIIQNLISHYIREITDGKTRVVLGPGIKEDDFVESLTSVAHKFLIAGQSLGDEMK